ncbi:hypothetical protein SMICM304S_07939 [Streptomyces microflavus]
MSTAVATGNLTPWPHVRPQGPRARRHREDASPTPRPGEESRPAETAPQKARARQAAARQESPGQRPAPRPAPTPTTASTASSAPSGGHRARRRRRLPLEGTARGTRPRPPQGRPRPPAPRPLADRRRRTWANLQGPVGDLVEILVTGAFGRLDLLAPLLLGAVAVRLILHPERPDANGGSPSASPPWSSAPSARPTSPAARPPRGRHAGHEDAGGLVGWAAATPLSYTMTDVLAVPLLVLLTVRPPRRHRHPGQRLPRRLRQLGVRLGLVEPRTRPERGAEATTNATTNNGARRCPPGPRGRRRRPAPGDDTPSTTTKTPSGGALPAPHPAPSACRSARGPTGQTPWTWAAAAAARRDGAVLARHAASPLVADLTQGVGTGTAVPTPPAPRRPDRRPGDGPGKDPGAAAGAAPAADPGHGGVPDLTSPPPTDREPAARAEQLQLSGDMTYALPSLDLLQRGGPARRAAPPTTP